MGNIIEYADLVEKCLKLTEENEQLRLNAQKIYADYIDRGRAMRETAKVVTSLYAPKNERLNKMNGKLLGLIKRTAMARDESLRAFAEYAYTESVRLLNDHNEKSKDGG